MLSLKKVHDLVWPDVLMHYNLSEQPLRSSVSLQCMWNIYMNLSSKADFHMNTIM